MQFDQPIEGASAAAGRTQRAREQQGSSGEAQCTGTNESQ